MGEFQLGFGNLVGRNGVCDVRASWLALNFGSKVVNA